MTQDRRPVLVPSPNRDFDPTEVTANRKVLTGRGHRIVFATPDGEPGACDEIMITGIRQDASSAVPLLCHVKVFGLLLRANADVRRGEAATMDNTCRTTNLTHVREIQ